MASQGFHRGLYHCVNALVLDMLWTCLHSLGNIMPCQEGADTCISLHFITITPIPTIWVHIYILSTCWSCILSFSQSIYEVHKHITRYDWENNVIIESKCNQKLNCIFRCNLVCDLCKISACFRSRVNVNVCVDDKWLEW